MGVMTMTTTALRENLKINHSLQGGNVHTSHFASPVGCAEYYLLVQPERGLGFADSLEHVLNDLRDAMKQRGLNDDSLVFTRIFLSDIENQKSALKKSELYSLLHNGAISIVGQTPALMGIEMLVLVYCLKPKRGALDKHAGTLDDTSWRNALTISGNNYDMLWVGNLTGDDPLNSAGQTTEIFSTYRQLLNEHDMDLFNNTVRTWIYVRDIDNHYKGMVDARVDIFEHEGLTQDTHYIASTGIEAKAPEVSSLVSMDAIAYSNLTPDQIIRMEAPDYLCPTHDYGVTFERGTRVRFGDRSHLYISGTASIDKCGRVLHETDVTGQTKRAMLNVEKLLEEQGASLDDMAYLIVYLRNTKDIRAVKKAICEHTKDEMPVIFVKGSVCRPSWLVEVEGVAITPDENAFPPIS
jgi:enamine deaminase RidA (YjgF/YER057c/UK114 family)